MPPFGSRKQPAPETTSPEPMPEQQPAPSPASERLQLLLAEQSEINATLAEHREQRAELLLEDGTLGAIRALATEDDGLRLRLEQIALRMPAIEQELRREQQEEFEVAWQSRRPGLAHAETELVEAIKVFQAALEHANKLYFQAQAFGTKLHEFATPPPNAPIYNDWSLRQYIDVVARRRQQVPAAPYDAMMEMVIEAPLNIPPERRFVPRRVAVAAIEAISPIAGPRRVRIVHGPVRTANLQIGIARMHPGETHGVSARAAHALVASGIAVYTDVETAETTAVA